MKLFDNALSELADKDFLEPKSFMDYAKEAGFARAKTADNISIQAFRGLASELREAGVMVFRLGRSTNGRGTNFALAKHAGSWGDYFFQDETIFGKLFPTLVTGVVNDLRIFQILPRSTETSLVNLAIASGVLHASLGLDDIAIVNATAQGTYTFSVRPHRQMGASWEHLEGQVEIDGAFVASRNGVETLFVVEAKVSNGYDSLPKHKIAYPMLALEPALPASMPVVGVYLRVLRTSSGFDFCVAECVFSSLHKEIESLTLARAGIYRTENRRQTDNPRN